MPVVYQYIFQNSQIYGIKFILQNSYYFCIIKFVRHHSSWIRIFKVYSWCPHSISLLSYFHEAQSSPFLPLALVPFSGPRVSSYTIILPFNSSSQHFTSCPLCSMKVPSFKNELTSVEDLLKTKKKEQFKDFLRQPKTFLVVSRIVSAEWGPSGKAQKPHGAKKWVGGPASHRLGSYIMGGSHKLRSRSLNCCRTQAVRGRVRFPHLKQA